MPSQSGIYYFQSNGKSREKPAVILIHGAAGNHLNWPHTIRRLGEHRVFALDLPAHGKSNGIGEQSIEGYCRILDRWMTGVGISQAVVIGHSMGGAIALMMALEYPDQVLGLGLVSTGAKMPVNQGMLDMLQGESTFPKAIELIVKWSYAQELDPKTKRQVMKQMLENRPGAVYGDFLACSQFDVRERLGEIKMPAVVITGSEDKMMAVSSSEYLHENISDSRLHIIEGGGHMVMLEKPDEAGKLVSQFLKEFD